MARYTRTVRPAPSQSKQEHAELLASEYWTKRFRKSAYEQTIEWMNNAINSIDRDLRDLRSDRDRLIELQTAESIGDEESRTTPVDVVSWFVNKLGQVGSNARVDLAVNRAVELQRTQPARKQS